MQLLHQAEITHVSYILILYSIAFILFLCKFRRFCGASSRAALTDWI
jgi:hypothetical protein